MGGTCKTHGGDGNGTGFYSDNLGEHMRLVTFSLALRSSKNVGPFCDRCPLSLALVSCLHLFTFCSSKSWQSSAATPSFQWAQTRRTFQLYSSNAEAWICFRDRLDKRKQYIQNQNNFILPAFLTNLYGIINIVGSCYFNFRYLSTSCKLQVTRHGIRRKFHSIFLHSDRSNELKKNFLFFFTVLSC
jgi:hypothetical protein